MTLRTFESRHAPLTKTLSTIMLAAALVCVTVPQGASAHDVPDELGKGVRGLGHSATGLETKRIKGTGEGMPSVRGPFPDTVNMDFLRHYRPSVNVVERPTRKGGRGYALVGPHEILVPLVAAGVIERLGKARR